MGPHTSAGVALLWRALQKRGWSQGDLARFLGVHSGHVNRWLHGDRKPGRKPAGMLEEHLGVPMGSWDEPLSKRFELRPTG